MAMIRLEQIRGANAIPTTNLKGGYQILRKQEYLDKIPFDNKVEGMRVYCIDTETTFNLAKQKDGSLKFETETATEDDVRALFGPKEDYDN